MIIETALVELAKAGGTELFLSSSESLLKKVKTAKDIKQLLEKLAYDVADNIIIKEYDDKTIEQTTILENIIKILPNINKKEIINRIYKK